MLDLIIIGAGPAGIYAATCAAMNNLSAVLIESSSELGGQLNLYKEKAIYDMPGFSKIYASDLINQLYDQYVTYKDQVPLYLNTQALALHGSYGNYTLETNQGTFESKTILLANGGGMFRPRPLDAKHEETINHIYYYIKNVHELDQKDVIVLGGGDSAVDWALTLLEHAKSVTLIHRRNEFRAHQQNVDQFKKKGIIYTPYQPCEVLGKETVEGLIIKHVDTHEKVILKADAILVFYGAVPVKSRVDEWQVSIRNNAIMVHQDMSTSREGLYAVGNSVSYQGKLRMIVTALGEAATAIGTITKLIYPERTAKYKH